MALRTSRRAADLIATFKTIAVRVDNEQSVEIDLARYLSESVSLLRAPLEINGSTLMLDVAEGLRINIVADALQEALTRVYANILDHAFADGRNGMLHLSARTGDEGEVVIIISDNGHGIDAANLPKVFDPFFTTKSGVGGHVGLGLHVAFNHVTQRLKGEISIASTPGQGAVVTIRFRSGPLAGKGAA